MSYLTNHKWKTRQKTACYAGWLNSLNPWALLRMKMHIPAVSSAHTLLKHFIWKLLFTSFYKLRLVVFLTVSFSVGVKLQKGSCRSSGWRRNQSTLEDLQSLAIFGCLVSCPFSDNYWEGQIVKPRWMQVAVVYPFFFQTRLQIVSYFLRIIKRAEHAREKN